MAGLGEEGHRAEPEIQSMRPSFTQEMVVWHNLDHLIVTKSVGQWKQLGQLFRYTGYEDPLMTVNYGMAFGQAAMLLALGTKGYRAMLPNSSTKLYLPKVTRSSEAAIDMWIKANELDTNTDYFLELLEKGIGKPKDEINKGIMRPKYFQAQEAIDYGIADKIISSRDNAFDKRNYDEILAQSKAARRGAGGAQAAPSGFR